MLHEQISKGDIGIMKVLPWELCLDILTLLPVKTLLVLRVVCKSLLYVIDDSNFVAFHLRRFPDNVLDTQGFTLQRKFESNKSYLRCISKDGVDYDEIPITINTWHWHVQCSMDGLLILKLHNYHVLWNPSIKKNRQLSAPSLDPHNQHLDLGYHASCNDYKIVALCWDGAWIYSVKSDSWIDVSSSYKENNVDHYFIDCYNERISFNDGFVWFDECFLVFFDFGTEKFRSNKEMFYPVDYNKDRFGGLMVLDGGSTVGLWGYDVEDQPSIWALQTDSMSWIKRHKISVSPQLLRFGRCKNTLDFVEEEGEIVWKYASDDGQEVILYAIETHAKSCWEVYVESLIMLN